MADFEDGKEDGALRTIGEVSEALDIKTHVLRYWEQQFALLKPLKRSGGRRYYRPSDVALVEQINRLVHQEGYTLKGAEAVLRAQTRSGFNRRAEDKRKDDETGDGETIAPASAAIAPPANTSGTASATGTRKSERGETIAQLKSLRSRLATALDA